MASHDAHLVIGVLTTLPSIPLPLRRSRPPIYTPRLLIRAFEHDDLQALHVLRTQPEFMAETRRGCVDRNLDETRSALDDLIGSAHEGYIFGIWVRETGQLIGDGGIHSMAGKPLGWPEVGYKLGKESRGKGYATELMQAIIKEWWKLPRQRVEMKVHGASIGRADTPENYDKVRDQGELLTANVEISNLGSMRVLEKLGFEKFGEWDEPDTQLHKLGEPVTLARYKLLRPVD
ncbi:acetyltransferase domain-containing protein [Xylariaceae sp. FL0016]|nr:acetyltransferase domain-containing protein [Xylariaceae sp. FL0016]